MQFYRFIRVKSGIRGRKEEKKGEEEREGSARNFGERKKRETGEGKDP